MWNKIYEKAVKWAPPPPPPEKIYRHIQTVNPTSSIHAYTGFTSQYTNTVDENRDDFPKAAPTGDDFLRDIFADRMRYVGRSVGDSMHTAA